MSLANRQLAFRRCSLFVTKSARRIILAVSLLLVAPLLGAGAAGPMSPARLRCEYLTDPLGIDIGAPRFSWVLEHSQRGEIQTAYQVLVASRRELLSRGHGDVWDSSRVAS